jgi:cell wall-associated NlpC family hydrolase
LRGKKNIKFGLFIINLIFENQYAPFKIKNRPKSRKMEAIINVSVANLRAANNHRSELVSQVLLGEKVKLLQQQDEWWQVETYFDNYKGWINQSSLIVEQANVAAWSSSNLFIYLAEPAFIWKNTNLSDETVSDVVRGGLLRAEEQQYSEKEAILTVYLPDGRTGYVPRHHILPVSAWQQSITRSDIQTVIRKAKSMIGVPYLWGGTTIKGIDCSGFIQKLFRYEAGIQLPRDAWQQAQFAIKNESLHWQDWKIGSLLFFGTVEKVTHVALYLGNQAYIHADGFVRINSFDTISPDYNDYRKKTFLFAATI